MSLANCNMNSAFVTVLPENEIGESCIRELRKWGVDTSKIVRQQGRMGIYFLETGANQRPSKVVYDRAESAIARSKSGDIDWDTVPFAMRRGSTFLESLLRSVRAQRNCLLKQ